jgi:nucleotide-binding universal stress UspA family protein
MFNILVVGDASDPMHFAFEESARLALSIPESSVHVLYLAGRSDTLHDLEASASSLGYDTSVRAAELGIADRFDAVHLRAGEPADEIGDVARQVGASLVIVSGRGRLGRKHQMDAIHRELGCPVVVAVPPRTVVPEIEPACADCIAIRENHRREAPDQAKTGDRELWCARHDHRHLHAHTYGYRREHPLATHDSNVIPTGIAFG